MDLFPIYHPPGIPELLLRAASAPAMERLKDVEMHCGLSYSGFPAYRRCGAYSRHAHSLGVALIVYHFTGDKKQALAGLFHDISTPVFSHVVDFLRGDHRAQASIEDETESFLAHSPELTALLAAEVIPLKQVSDYHRYPLADNDSPRLSADRLEYTLGNFQAIQGAAEEDIRRLYNDLTILSNEDGQPEPAFATPESARRFAMGALFNGRHYVSDEDRFAMQYLADLLRLALGEGVLTPEDLYTTESAVIGKLNAAPATSKLWQNYRQLHRLNVTSAPAARQYCVHVPAKHRCIDPLVALPGGPLRASALFEDFREDLRRFLADDFDRWLSADLPDFRR